MKRRGRQKMTIKTISLKTVIDYFGFLIIMCVVIKMISGTACERKAQSILAEIAKSDDAVEAIAEIEHGSLLENMTEEDKMIALLSLQVPIWQKTESSEKAEKDNTIRETEPDISEEMPKDQESTHVPEQTVSEYDFDADKNAQNSDTAFADIDVLDYLDKSDIDNGTDYDINIAELIGEGISFTFDPDEPQVLIVHTHSSEAYTPTGESDTYEVSDVLRTEDRNFSVVRVGDELAEALEGYGINVLHDREIYDYPSYTGSYNRSLESVEKYVEEYPSIKVVIDLHRDAAGEAPDFSYKTVTEIGGQESAQVMIVSGTNASGLNHPYWKENLKLALNLQASMNYSFPGLARELAISQYRYNMHATTGSLILEVGYAGNTLEQAITAVRCFAKSAADVFSLLMEDK